MNNKIKWRDLKFLAEFLLVEDIGITFNEKCFKRLEHIIDCCEKYKIYSMCNLHLTIIHFTNSYTKKLQNHNKFSWSIK